MSTTVGVGHSTFAATASTKDPLEPFARNRSAISGVITDPIAASAVGVGNDEDAVTAVRGADGSRRDAVPLRIEPARGQVPENDIKPPNKESCDVLHDHESGSKVANCSHVLPPKAGAVPSQTGALAGVADVLAGEPTAHHLHWFHRRPVDGGHVLVTGGVRPVPRQHLTAERVALDLPDRAADAGPFEAELQPADP